MMDAGNYTDNGPDYQCPRCGADTTGEIGHECVEEGGEITLDGQSVAHLIASVGEIFEEEV